MSTNSISLQQFKTNGITLRAAVEGTGPLVIMVHGWPELWYSWRHQIRAVADAGYRVVAPDVRGYGGSDKPHPVEAYDMIQLTSDVVGLIDALGEEKAILVGHDWGAPICWNPAVLQPDRVSAVAGLSFPYLEVRAVSSSASSRDISNSCPPASRVIPYILTFAWSSTLKVKDDLLISSHLGLVELITSR